MDALRDYDLSVSRIDAARAIRKGESVRVMPESQPSLEDAASAFWKAGPIRNPWPRRWSRNPIRWMPARHHPGGCGGGRGLRQGTCPAGGIVGAGGAVAGLPSAHSTSSGGKAAGPVGLFLLTIADSGERKSTCDGFFVAAIRDYQEEQAEADEAGDQGIPGGADRAWESERSGILSEKIKPAGKKDKPTESCADRLAQLQHDKPEPPRVPRLLLGDETPENLAWSLAKQWPSGAWYRARRA
jgi:hypothetical protein